MASKIFDMAVNMGVHQAANYAQRAANGMITARVALPVPVGSAAAAASKTASGQSGASGEADAAAGKFAVAPEADADGKQADATLGADAAYAELKPLVPMFRLEEDGVMGDKSLAAINALDPIAYYQLLCDLSRQHYIHVASINPAQAGNLQGWLKRAAA
ncbi:MAG TPA: putative peptidoglycan-binding domain-containing protein [Candidatus Angelobacter sp.]|nr:putative peptidoglycan-binding domain-containing protein [Candidatus Angelobacter sp.]